MISTIHWNVELNFQFHPLGLNCPSSLRFRMEPSQRWAGCFEKHLLPLIAVPFCPSLPTWVHPRECNAPIIRTEKDMLDHRGWVKYPAWLSWGVLGCDQYWSLFEPQCFCLKRLTDPGRDRHDFVLSINFSQRNWIPLRNLCKELASSFWGQNTWMN